MTVMTDILTHITKEAAKYDCEQVYLEVLDGEDPNFKAILN